MPWRREGSLGGGRLFYASRLTATASGAPWASRAWLSPSDVEVHAGDAVVTAAAVVYYVSAARGARVFLGGSPRADGGYGYPLKPPVELPVATKQTSQSGSGALGCVRIGDGIDVNERGLVSVPTYSRQHPDVPSLVCFGADHDNPSGLNWLNSTSGGDQIYVFPTPYAITDLLEPGEGLTMDGGSAFGLLNVTLMPQVRVRAGADVAAGAALLRVRDSAKGTLGLGEDLTISALVVADGAASALDVSLDAGAGTLSTASAVKAGDVVVIPPVPLRRYFSLLIS